MTPNLDLMRLEGDDDATRALDFFERRMAGDIRSLAGALTGFDYPPELDALERRLAAGQHGLARALFQGSGRVLTRESIEEGQRLFREHGVKMLMILCCYSLPAAFAAQNGVKVLHKRHGGLGRLQDAADRRLVETAQMVIYVFSSGGLATQGNGIRAARRVRLLHAAVRHLILGRRTAANAPAWNVAGLGVPINQEDLAATLMTFSYLILEGFRKLHIDIEPKTQQAFLEIWLKIGEVMGIRDDLLPANVGEAQRLTEAIKERQIDAPIRKGIDNQEGKELTAALVRFMLASLPWFLRWAHRLPASTIRRFLPHEVAMSLGLPRTLILDPIVNFFFFVEGKINNFRLFRRLNDRLQLRGLSFFFNMRLLERIREFDRSGHRAFDLCDCNEALGFNRKSLLRRVCDAWKKEDTDAGGSGDREGPDDHLPT